MSQESKFRQALQRSRTLRILIWLASFGVEMGLAFVIVNWLEHHPLVASWVFPGFLLALGSCFAIMLGIGAVVATRFIWSVFVRPKDRNRTIAHRVAHSPWIENGPIACGAVATAAVTFSLVWNGHVLLAYVALTIGMLVSVGVLYAGIQIWATNYRFARFEEELPHLLAEYERQEREGTWEDAEEEEEANSD